MAVPWGTKIHVFTAEQIRDATHKLYESKI